MVKKMVVGSVGGARGERTEFWRELSWRVGDEHADRICRWLDGYCWLFKLDRAKFHGHLPRK